MSNTCQTYDLVWNDHVCRKRGTELLKGKADIIENSISFTLIKCKPRIYVEELSIPLKDLAFVSIREASK